MLQAPGATLTWTPTLIRVANAGDLAYDLGTYTFSFDGPDGKVTDTGKYVTVWTKVDGQWKIAADIGNSDLPESN
jgi:ketosteroid isomerase-like protein